MRAAPLLAALAVVLLALAGCSGKTAPVTVTETKTRTSTTTTAVTTVSTTNGASLSTSSSPSTGTTSATLTSTTTTAPAEPGVRPQISNATTDAPDQTSVKVRWTMNGSSDVQSRIEYGVTGFTSQTPIVNGTGSHVADIGGLASCTAYSARVRATGGGFLVLGDPFSFTTIGNAPVLGTVATSSILHDGFKVSWALAGADDAKSFLEYGPSSAYGARTPDVGGTGLKTATLTGLAQNAVYHFRVIVQSACGGVTGTDRTERTAKLLEVEIYGNSGPASYGRPGQAAGGPMAASLDGQTGLNFVFRVHNGDAAIHGWNMQGQTESLPSIPSGATQSTAASIRLGPGTYTMYCNFHSNMQTTLQLTS